MGLKPSGGGQEGIYLTFEVRKVRLRQKRRGPPSQGDHRVAFYRFFWNGNRVEVVRNIG